MGRNGPPRTRSESGAGVADRAWGWVFGLWLSGALEGGAGSGDASLDLEEGGFGSDLCGGHGEGFGELVGGAGFGERVKEALGFGIEGGQGLGCGCGVVVRA